MIIGALSRYQLDQLKKLIYRRESKFVIGREDLSENTNETNSRFFFHKTCPSHNRRMKACHIVVTGLHLTMTMHMFKNLLSFQG